MVSRLPALTPITICLEICAGSPLINFSETVASSSTGIAKSSQSSLTMPNNNRRVRAAKPSMMKRGDTREEGAPPVADRSSPVQVLPTREACQGARVYSEVVVETYGRKGPEKSTSGSSVTPISEGESGSRCVSEQSSSLVGHIGNNEESIAFFSGNPFVEKTTGVLHFYKPRGNVKAEKNCRTLCMLAVPAQISCTDLLKLLAPVACNLCEMKIVRDQSPNQYMVILHFQNAETSHSFFAEYDGMEFSSLVEARIKLVMVERVESSIDPPLQREGMIELPTCAVCLERMDDGVLTILCNHSFHSHCLLQWADSTCPVCRCCQTPELAADQKCFDCGKTTDLWICLICGNIGCGRYADAHAYRHFESTSHTFTLQVGGERVWDYAGDNYVHRLIQSSADGKVVEYQRPGANSQEVEGEEKMEAMQLEYTCLLTTQLEQQRSFYTEKLSLAENRLTKFEKLAQAQIEELEAQVKRAVGECESLRTQLSTMQQTQTQTDRKHQISNQRLQKVQGELNEERLINKTLRDDQEAWSRQVNQLQTKLDTAIALRNNEVDELKEQIRDLMFHFEAENKVRDETARTTVTEQEMQEGHLVVGAAGTSPSKGRKGRKKSSNS